MLRGCASWCWSGLGSNTPDSRSIGEHSATVYVWHELGRMTFKRVLWRLN